MLFLRVITDRKGTVSILAPCFYMLGFKTRVKLSVQKPVLHFLNVTKQNYDFLKICVFLTFMRKNFYFQVSLDNVEIS